MADRMLVFNAELADKKLVKQVYMSEERFEPTAHDINNILSIPSVLGSGHSPTERVRQRKWSEQNIIFTIQ